MFKNKKTSHFTESRFPIDPDTKKYLIEIRVETFKQIFNNLDPAPFVLRDLDFEVADYIIRGIKEIPKNREFSIDFHIPKIEKDLIREEKIKKSVFNFFDYNLKLSSDKLKQLLKSTIIGFIIALPILILSAYLTLRFGQNPNLWHITILNGTTVAGWVALWTPISNLLYNVFSGISDIKLYQRICNAEIRFFYYEKH